MAGMGAGDGGAVGLRSGVLALAKAESAKEIGMLGTKNQVFGW